MSVVRDGETANANLNKWTLCSKTTMKPKTHQLGTLNWSLTLGDDQGMVKPSTYPRKDATRFMDRTVCEDKMSKAKWSDH